MMNRNHIQILTKVSVTVLISVSIFIGASSSAVLAGEAGLDVSKKVSAEIINQLYLDSRLDETNNKILIRRTPFLAREFDTPGAFDSLTVRSISRNAPQGLYPIIVEIFRDGEKVRHGQATAYIARFDSVLVTDGALTKGALPVSASLITEFLETTNLRSRPIKKLAEMENKRFRRNLRRGSIITEETLELIPDIDFGDDVTIEFNTGLLSMTVSGSSLGRGTIGETVRVRNLTSKRIIHGTITGSGTVRVNSPGG